LSFFLLHIISIEDSLRIAKHTSETVLSQQKSEFLNYFFGIVGLIGTIIAIYSLIVSTKNKKYKDLIYKQAQAALEKEDAENQIYKKKEELSNIEKKLTDLQNQIQKDLPIAARKAVIKDKLDESFKNLNKYLEDVIFLKNDLENLGEDTDISNDLLKSIQNEIEPRYFLKEKISNYKTWLTIISTISGLAFAFLPYPISKFIGGIFLLSGLPIVLQILKLTIVKKSSDKQKTNLLIIYYLSLTGSIVSFCLSAFALFTFINIGAGKGDTLFIFSLLFLVLSGLSGLFAYKFHRRLKTINKENNNPNK
jgi:uncharacterized membrane protein